MPVLKVNENTMRFMVGSFTAEVSTFSQNVTVFLGDLPAGTLCRRRVIERNKPEWSIFDKTGRKLGEHNMVSPLLHILRRETLREA